MILITGVVLPLLWVKQEFTGNKLKHHTRTGPDINRRAIGFTQDDLWCTILSCLHLGRKLFVRSATITKVGHHYMLKSIHLSLLTCLARLRFISLIFTFIFFVVVFVVWRLLLILCRVANRSSTVNVCTRVIYVLILHFLCTTILRSL